MNVFEMVTVIVFLGIVGRIAQTAIHAWRDRQPVATDIDPELRALRQRVAVLEQVITENESGLRLDREIERLRNSND